MDEPMIREIQLMPDYCVATAHEIEPISSTKLSSRLTHKMLTALYFTAALIACYPRIAALP
jgi:hypothetical protein